MRTPGSSTIRSLQTPIIDQPHDGGNAIVNRKRRYNTLPLLRSASCVARVRQHESNGNAAIPTMEVDEKASQPKREGRSIIHLELGEPDFDTPPAAIEAGRKG